MKTLFTSLGYIGSCLIATMQIPQIYLTYKRGKIQDLSIYTIGMNLIAAGCMISYATYYKLYPVIISNSCITTCDFILVFLYFKYKKSHNDWSLENIEKQITLPT